VATTETHVAAEPTSRTGNPNASALLLLVSAVWLGILLLFETEFGHLPLRAMAIVLLTSELAIGALIYRTDRRRAWSFPFLYFVVLVLFHSGLYVAPALLGRLAAVLRTPTSDWFDEQLGIRAAYIVAVAAACYAMGYAVSRLTARAQSASEPAPDPDRAANERQIREGIADFGGLLTLLAVLVWLMISVTAVGSDFFLRPYLEYLGATSGSHLPWVFLMLLIGVTLSALDLRRRLSQIAIGAFAVYALLALMVGLRADVFIPLIAAVGVLGCTHSMPRARGFWLAAAGVLIAISVVSQVRVHGVANTTASDIALSPVAAVEEMGHSIRPLTVSVGWHEGGRRPYLWGATYVAPLDRQVRRLLGLPVRATADDFRLMNVEVAARIGAIGGSTIAEAHHNGGVPGVLIVMTLIGGLAGRLFAEKRSAVRIALSGVVAVLLLMHVRNSFAPIPGWAVMGFGCVALGVLIGKLRRHLTVPSHRRRSVKPRNAAA
jgi:O-antigen polysaccharide polymerase Wzy